MQDAGQLGQVQLGDQASTLQPASTATDLDGLERASGGRMASGSSESVDKYELQQSVQ